MEINLLSTIQSILQLRKEIPDPVGYDTYGPISFPLPHEIQELLEGNQIKSDFINITSIRVDNYSSKTQKDIRVLYSGDYEYKPAFKFHRREIPVKFEVLESDKEFLIKEIPPNESVSIEIFNPSTEFELVQVLSGDGEITSVMQKLAEARRYPELARMKLFTHATVIFAIVAVAFTGYLTWSKLQESSRIEEAYSGFASCSPSLMKNPPENEKILERKFKRLDVYWQNYILSSNKVNSLEELGLKNELVWCEPKQP